MPLAPRWIFPSPADAPPMPGVPRAVAGLLHRRGITDTAGFLDPRLQDLSDPFLLTGMNAVVARLLAAIDANERVTLYGDYDVDGVTSLALLREALLAYGLDASVFLPHRMDEGYGLSEEGVLRCLADSSPSLVVAVDCGTTSVAEAALLKSHGVDLVILDHHEAGSAGLPECAALLNPKASGEQPYLCSAGIVFKVVHALLKSRPLDKATFDLKAHLDLVAMGTVADIVPLIGENRTLVRHGLGELARTRRPGLLALKSVAGVNGKPAASDVGFKLGPRLNAAGRLDTARHAFDLLTTRDHATAEELAGLLDDQNRERQQVEHGIMLQAMEMAAAFGDAPALVLAGDDWHPGVVGIVASRVMRHFHRPTFIIGFDTNGLGKGSARSIPGISLITAIEACRAHLVKGGGHDMAAGITIAPSNIDTFRDAITAHIAATAASDLFQPVLAPDAVVAVAELNDSLLDSWELLAPFGASFPEPLLAVRGVEPAAAPRVLKEKHYKFTVRGHGGQCDAIWFQAATRGPMPPPPWDIVFTLEANEWNGRRSPQMLVKAVRTSA